MFCAAAVCAYAQAPGAGAEPQLGPAPIASDRPAILPRAPVQTQITGTWFDVSNRSSIQSAYQTFTATSPVSLGFTGAVGTCVAGGTSQQYKDAALQRINWYRAMAGVPGLTGLDATYSTQAQSAALMMSANGQLSHTPPPSWTCYTAAGATAAGKSNICLGYNLTDDPGCIRAYMDDTGSNNTVVGHRRWLLYPQTQTMGTGDVVSGGGFLYANAVWVQDSHIFDPRPATRENFVAWPPPDYVPYELAYARWSFSYPGADFSSATVTMQSGGASISLNVLPL